MRDLASTVVRNSAVGMSAQLAVRLLSFGFSVLIVRNLGAGTYGQYSAVLAFGAMFVIVSDLGLSPYAVREVARWRDVAGGQEQTERLYGNVLVSRLLLSLLTIILTVSSAWLTGRPLIMIGGIVLASMSLLLYAVQGASDALLAGFERLDLSARARIPNQLAFVVLGAVALLIGIGYYGLIVANLVGVAVMTGICWQAVRRLGVRPRRATRQAWPVLVRASLPFGVIGFAQGLSYNFDSVLLNVFRGDAETGYYNAAYKLVFAAVVVSNVVNTALYPSLARQAASGPELLPAIYERVARYLMLLSLPIAVGTWALARRLLSFLYTAAFLPAVPALQIVIWVTPLMFASEFLGYVVIIQGDEKLVARSLLVSTGANVALNVVLVPRFGLLGAAAMTVITEAILVGQYVWLLRSLIRQFDWNVALFRPLTAALLMGGVLLVLRSLSLPAEVLAGALTYAGLLVALGVVGKDELSFVRRLRQQLALADTVAMTSTLHHGADRR
ncbi:MAG TPA: flippase [Chloroflexota bacterium]|nr:flippase [Chloroflexota bacterium]